MKYSKITFFLILLLFLPVSCAPRRKAAKVEPSIKKTRTITGNFIKGIKAESLESSTAVEIEVDGSIRYTSFKLTDPLRLVIDLSDVKAGGLVTPIDVNGKIINTIRHQYFKSSNVTRVEIGLNKIVPHEITRHGKNKIVINLTGTGTSDRTLKSETEGISAAARTKSGKIEKISAVREPAAALFNSAPAPSLQGTVPEIYTETEYVPDDKPEKKEYEKKGVEKKKRYTGRLISLDFQDAGVTNILRLIAEVSGYNVITSDDVKGKVNLKLINVPWDQALDIILKSGELGMIKEDNIIRIMPIKRLEREMEENIKAQKAKVEAEKAIENAEEMFTEVIPINYATAGELIKNLEKLKSARGEIDINERTNTLIIKDIRKSLEEIKSLIAKLDRRTPQVVIEARIVEVSRIFTRELGVQWGGLYNKATSYAFPNNVGVRGGITPASSTSDLSLINTMPGGGSFLLNMPAAVGSGSGAAIGLTLGHIANSAALDITLSALEDSGNGKILSNPKITTEDNKEAVIESGRSIPYATVSQSGTSVQFVDATINLTVTPHITQDNYVSLKIMVTKNDADFANSVQGTPSIIKKKATTQVLIADGDTTVIGGLYTNDDQESVSGVPWFSEIPVLGWLFKKKKNTRSSTELLIFITPKILKT